MDSTTLKAQINSEITNETAPNSISPADVGGNMTDIVDYIDQQAPVKTSASIALSATTQVLPNDINSCSFSGGKAYLPDTDVIGKEVYVIAVSSNIEIQANEETTARMFVTFNTFVTSVILNQYEMYRFTYIGFDTGTGGYWKAELLA